MESSMRVILAFSTALIGLSFQAFAASDSDKIPSQTGNEGGLQLPIETNDAGTQPAGSDRFHGTQDSQATNSSVTGKSEAEKMQKATTPESSAR
jgi:hypothetical protein